MDIGIIRPIKPKILAINHEARLKHVHCQIRAYSQKPRRAAATIEIKFLMQ